MCFVLNTTFKAVTRDLWVPNIGPLCKKIVPNSNLDMDCTRSDLVTENKDWNLDFFHLWLFKEIVQQIMGDPPPQANSSMDRII